MNKMLHSFLQDQGHEENAAFFLYKMNKMLHSFLQDEENAAFFFTA
jgi:hypothetical protein